MATSSGTDPAATAADVVASLATTFPDVAVDLHADSNGVWRLSRIAVPEAARRAGTGTKVLDAICAAADQAGVTVACTPATDWGSTKAGLVRFYRRAGFTPNKGPGRDLSISESMLRHPR